MNALLAELFGTGSDLTSLQMVLRGVVVFGLTLVMFRISGRRSLGQHSPFDACITVLLGAILSRAVVGASPFLATMATGFALVLIHRLVAMLSARSERLSILVNGRSRTLVREGRADEESMRKALVSKADLAQALRERGLPAALDNARQIVLERNGVISVVSRGQEFARSSAP